VVAYTALWQPVPSFRSHPPDRNTRREVAPALIRPMVEAPPRSGRAWCHFVGDERKFPKPQANK